ncbi:unnamed protein product [Mortierella alpina]
MLSTQWRHFRPKHVSTALQCSGNPSGARRLVSTAFEKRAQSFIKEKARQLEQSQKSSSEPRPSIDILLPDGTKKTGAAGITTPLEIAQGMSGKLAKTTLIAQLNGKTYWDMSRPLEQSCQLELVPFQENNDRLTNLFWHSSAHVLGMSLEAKYGSRLLLCDGPAIKQGGFFYEFLLAKQDQDPSVSVTELLQQNYPSYKFSPEEIADIQRIMHQFVSQRLPFERLSVSQEFAYDLFPENKFKQHFIGNIPKDSEITLYKCGPFVDLCRGPHVQHTGQLQAMEILKTSNAYFMPELDRDPKSPQALTRMYGIAFPSAKELKQWHHQRNEAERRDHRVIGKSQGLFAVHQASPGSAFMLPHGTRIVERLMRFMRQQYRKYGFEEVMTPLMYKKELWETSGHWQNYKDDMFQVQRGCGHQHHEGHGDEHKEGAVLAASLTEGHDEVFGLKPMNCPGHCLIFDMSTRSYKELPIRYADFSALHRNEATGSLSGLTRVRRFHQDDAHIFCTRDQIFEEIRSTLSFVDTVYRTFRFPSYELALSTRPLSNLIGTSEEWDQAEDALRQALNQSGRDWTLNEGDGAFYGPKIDILVRDALGRRHQTATIQLDFQLPQRFGLQFYDQQGEKQNPVIVHRAVLGSVERMMAILIEHTGGRWPFWMSPRQAMVVPVFGGKAGMEGASATVEGEDSGKTKGSLTEYARHVKETLAKAGRSPLRPEDRREGDGDVVVGMDDKHYFVDMDQSGGTLNKMVRDAQVAQYNFILVTGEKEKERGTVNVRTREGERLGEMTIPQVLELFKEREDQYFLLTHPSSIMDSPSRQSSIIESPSLRKHRDMFPLGTLAPRYPPSPRRPRRSKAPVPITPSARNSPFFTMLSTRTLTAIKDTTAPRQQDRLSSRRATATSTSQPAGGTSSSVSALHLHQAAEMEDSLAKLLDDSHYNETNASLQARASTLKARKSLDSLRQSQRRSLDSMARSPSRKSALPPRLRTTETEYDVSPSRTARLMSTPAASSFVGTPSRRGRDFDEEAHVTPENLATLEWIQQTADASDNDQNQYATETTDNTEKTERLDQKYTRQTSIVDDEQEQQRYEDPSTRNWLASSQRSYHNSPAGHRRSSERAHDTYSEKENIPAYTDRTAPQVRPSPKSPKYVERVLEPRTPEPNHSVVEAESSLLEVAETTTTLTNELRGVYTKMQDFFSPETEAKLNGAISVIGSQKVTRVAKGLTSATTKPRPLDFRSASVRKNYKTPSTAKHSSRPLTEPVPFNFSERLDRLQRRHMPHLLQKSGGKAWSTPGAMTGMQHKQHHRDEIAHRASTPPVQSRSANEYQEMSKSPFIPLDQRKRLLAKNTIIRSEQAKRPLTQPKSPVLRTRTRHKLNMDHHHYQEHLDDEASHHHGYKAHTLDRRIFEQGGISGVPKVTKQPLTVPKSPVFTKRRPAALRSAVMPSKPNVHHPQQQDSGRMHTGITQRSLVSSAESARRLSEEQQHRPRRHDLGLGHRSVQGRAHSAKPALTVPEPFSFVTDARGERYQEQFRNKLGKWRQIEKEHQFKALPLPDYPDMFVPKKSTKPLTHTEPIVLQTDRRAEEREVFEQERRRKEQLLQDMLAEKAREDELRELQELRELRKRLVPHPTPIRDYPRIEIHKSTRPLTIPHSPNIGEKRKRQMTLEREISSSHEDHYHHPNHNHNHNHDHHPHQHQHAVPTSTHGQYTREDLEHFEREFQREQERAQDQDFERRRVSATHLRDNDEQHQRQDLVRQEIERQRETDAYHRHELELQKQQQQQQQQQRQPHYSRHGQTIPAAFEDQEELAYGYDEEHGHNKRQRLPEEEDLARAQPNFYRTMGRKSWLEANDL